MFRLALVTGGTGFVGRHFLSRLATSAPELAVCVAGRSVSSARLLERVQFVPLDLSKTIDLSIAPDIVFHIAGEKRDESKMWEVNLDGTRRLLDWSLEKGVKRFVYLSSVGVYGASKSSGVINEDAFKYPQNAYEMSKSAAEDEVRTFCSSQGIEYVVLQPSNVIGLTGGDAYPLLGMMKMIKRGLFTYFDEGKACFNYVAVEDVAEGLCAAMSPLAANRTFILNTPAQMKQAVEWIADEIGVPCPRRRLPAVLGFIAGEVASMVSSMAGKPLPFSRNRFDELTNTTCYEGRAITRMGFNYPLGVEAAVRQLVRFYKKEGLL